jgi:hypothetical protein
MFHQGRILYTSLVSLIMTLICLDPANDNIYCYFHDLCAKKMFEQKRFAGRHLLTFESQKLNYFGKKGGPAFWHYNVISLCIMNIWLHNILCDFFYPFKPRVESFWGVLSWCLTPSILFNFRYKKIKIYG